MKEHFLTSESVSEGHPDKLADQIADAILDACIKEDRDSKVACEVLVSGNRIIIAGEITTAANLSDRLPEVVTGVIKEAGYTNPSCGLDDTLQGKVLPQIRVAHLAAQLLAATIVSVGLL